VALESAVRAAWAPVILWTQRLPFEPRPLGAWSCIARTSADTLSLTGLLGGAPSLTALVLADHLAR
jgi:hypothetical protein